MVFLIATNMLWPSGTNVNDGDVCRPEKMKPWANVETEPTAEIC